MRGPSDHFPVKAEMKVNIKKYPKILIWSIIRDPEQFDLT